MRRGAQGVAGTDETNVKVVEVVLDRLAYGPRLEEIPCGTQS